MSLLDIRPVNPSDQADLACLMLASNRHYWGENASAEAMTRAAAKRIAEGDIGCRAIIGRLDGAPVAFATFAILLPSLNEHGTLFMKDLFVADRCRGEGAGKQMMACLAALAFDQGCERFDWTAETDNPGAVGFYEHLAAETVKEKVYFRLSGDDLRRVANGGASVSR